MIACPLHGMRRQVGLADYPPEIAGQVASGISINIYMLEVTNHVVFIKIINSSNLWQNLGLN